MKSFRSESNKYAALCATASHPQRSLALVDQAILPLSDISYARVRLGLREDAVMDAILDGKLRYAFNIASPGSDRAEIRILTECVEALRAKVPQPEYRNIAERILPRPTQTGRHQTIRGVVLAERFVCSQWLIGHLIEKKELDVCPGNLGPKVSPLIIHASAVDFLLRRLIEAKSPSGLPQQQNHKC